MILGILLLLLASPASPEASAAELKSMAGTWRPVSAENNGYAASAADLQGTLWTRDADGKWTLRRGDEILVEWQVRKIDAAKYPKTIDLEIVAGPYKGMVYQGIYELEGDLLRICFTLPGGGERPTEFSAGIGTIRALSEFQREKE